MPSFISDVDIGNKIVWNLMFVAFSAALALQICHSWKRKVYQMKTLISIIHLGIIKMAHMVLRDYHVSCLCLRPHKEKSS